MSAPLPFHQWKTEQVARDSAINGVHRFYRERSWYWRYYGRYLQSMRKVNHP